MFKMKCYDGKTILVNKCNNYTSGLLTNYDTLISDLDLVKDYKIDGLHRYNYGSTYFEDATGIDARVFSEKYTKENLEKQMGYYVPFIKEAVCFSQKEKQKKEVKSNWEHYEKNI